MISHDTQSQLVINQEKLNHRHYQILANHQELENKYFKQDENIIKTDIPQPLRIKKSDYNLEEKRLLVIARSQAAN